MRVLFLGDIVANAGRKVIKAFLPDLIQVEQIDYVVANSENAAGGLGIDEKTALELFESGIDMLTGGNHSWDKKDVYEYIAREPRLLRPANYPRNASFPVPGKGLGVIEKNGKKLAVINLMGRVFMETLDDPFAVADQLVKECNDLAIHNILIDFHAEATSEKQAFAHYLAGRVSAVVGSHSHVQTADERLLIGNNGFATAYITDAGMTGPYDSVIGMKKERSIQRFVSKLPQKYEPAEGQPGLHGVLIDIDSASGEAQRIVRVSRFL